MRPGRTGRNAKRVSNAVWLVQPTQHTERQLGLARRLPRAIQVAPFLEFQPLHPTFSSLNMPPKSSASAEPTERRVSSRIAAQAPKPEPNAKASAKDAKAKKDPAETSASTTKRKATSQPKEDKSEIKLDQGAKKGKATPAEANQTEEPASASTANGKKQLSVGDALPSDLVLNDEAGKEVRVSELKKAVIFM